MEQVDAAAIERMAIQLARVRELGGRLFILEAGGFAADARRAVADFRNLCGFEAYAPTDNVSELPARVSGIGSRDGVLVFSLGGANRETNASVDIAGTLEAASQAGAHIFGIVGSGGELPGDIASQCVVIPPLTPDRLSLHAEGLCALLWRLLVCHPLLQRVPTKWESVR